MLTHLKAASIVFTMTPYIDLAYKLNEESQKENSELLMPYHLKGDMNAQEFIRIYKAAQGAALINPEATLQLDTKDLFNINYVKEKYNERNPQR